MVHPLLIPALGLVAALASHRMLAAAPVAPATQARPGKTVSEGGKNEKTRPSLSIEDLAASVKPSVVRVIQEGREGRQEGIGTGFVVAPGLIATNLHVIGEARRIEVETVDKKRLEVTEITATDSHWDLALIKVSGPCPPALPLGNSDQLKQGQAVVAMGNPEGLAFSIVSGVISEYPDVVNEVPMIRLAMPIERGNSGGPLLDMQGRVQGLLTMKSAVTDNLGFAMPVNPLKQLQASPNPVPMQRWLTIGVLDPAQWQPQLGGRWSQHSGTLKSSGSGEGFGGRTFCLSMQKPPAKGAWEVAASVRLDEESGAAGLIFCTQPEGVHYGFYPSNGRLRLTRFEGPDVTSWTVLREIAHEAYRPKDWNHLRVRIEPQRLIAWVNGREVLSVAEDGLRGGGAGLCRFRSPGAQFRQFRMGSDLAEKPLPTALAKSLETALDQFASGQTGLQQSLQKLLPNASAARRQLQDKRRELQRQTQALRELEQQLHQANIRGEIARELEKPEAKSDLLRACLLLDSHDNPQVDVSHYQQQVQRLANELKADPEVKAGTARAIARIRKHLFEQGGFHGSRHDYGNRNNSYLSAVIDDREGLPISLSVLFLEVAWRLGLREVVGLPLPGQFMVGWRDSAKGALHIIDPFEGGRERSLEELADELNDGEPLLPEMLEAASKKAIVMRMINNLLNLAREDEDQDRLAAYLSLQIALEGDNALARLERAQLRHREGHLEQAREDVLWLNENLPEETPDHLRRQMQRWLESLREPPVR